MLKIKSVLLAILLLIASNTYAVTWHFCKGFLVDTSYLGGVTTCGMDSSKEGCKQNTSFKSNCCSEVTQLIESDVDFLLNDVSNFLLDVDFIQYNYESSIDVFSHLEKEYQLPRVNSPPDIEQNFQVLFETFLI